MKEKEIVKALNEAYDNILPVGGPRLIYAHGFRDGIKFYQSKTKDSGQTSPNSASTPLKYSDCSTCPQDCCPNYGEE